MTTTRSARPLIIDCHAHFYPPVFSKRDIIEWSETAAAARSDGRTDTAWPPSAVIVVPETLADCQTVLEIAASGVPGYLPCIGLHPVQPIHSNQETTTTTHGVRSARISELQPVLDLIDTHADSIAAIGECGLDFSPHALKASSPSPSPDTDPYDSIRAEQRQIFQHHINASKTHGIPLNVHSRNAGHHAITQLITSNATSVLLHAFDGKPAHALHASQHGFYLSVPASVMRSPTMQSWIRQIPLTSLVLETDAPALAKHKTTRINTVMACHDALVAVADLKQMDIDTVAEITTENAVRLFPRLRGVLDHICGSDTSVDTPDMS